MKSTIKTVLAALVVGLAIGIVWGTIAVRQHRWDPSMETTAFWKNWDANEESKRKDAEEGRVKAPRVEVPEENFDFGVLEKNKTTIYGSHDYVIKNVGNAPLTLKEKDKSCYCTQFSIAKKTLAPGESTTVNVSWDADRGGGDFKQTVLIETNDPLQTEVFLNVKGLFTSPVVCNPNQLHFTGISNTEEYSREFHLLGFGTDENKNPLPLEITPYVSDPEHFDVTVTPGTVDMMTEDEKANAILGNATSLVTAVFTVKPGLPQGAFQEIVRFKTNRPDLPSLELMAEGQVAGAISISGRKYDKHKSGQLILGAVSSAENHSENIRLTVTDKSFFLDSNSLYVVKTRPDWLKVTMQYPEAEMQKNLPVKWADVTVEIPAGSPQGRYSGPELSETGEIVFEAVNGENRQEIVLPVNFAVGP